jgi:hypothetical protein
MSAEADRIVAPAAVTGGAERRASTRHAALREGRVMTVEGLGPAVLIVDISSGGALIRLRAPLELPQDLVLIDRATAFAHRASVVRRQELDVGLRFLRSQSLAGAVPPALEPARAWCRGG